MMYVYISHSICNISQWIRPLVAFTDKSCVRLGLDRALRAELLVKIIEL